MHPSYFDQTAILALAVGLYSLTARRNPEIRSSWPTWLLVPLVLVLTLHWAVPYRDPLRPNHLLRPYEFLVFVLVLGRWAFALQRCERNKGWGFYLLLPLGTRLLFEMLT
jgi:hypothetical protein